MQNNITWKVLAENNEFYWKAFDKYNNLIGKSNIKFGSQRLANINADMFGMSSSYDRNLNWTVYQNQNGWNWSVENNANRQEVGHSHKSYTTKNEAIENANLFGYNSNIKPVGAVNAGAMESTLVASNALGNWWKWLLALLLLLLAIWFLFPNLFSNWFNGFKSVSNSSSVSSSVVSSSSQPNSQATNSSSSAVQTSSTNSSSTTSSVATSTQFVSSGLIDALKGTGIHNTLVAAIDAAGLTKTLDDSKGVYTIFAPDDSAFAAIQPTVDELLKPENKAKLQDLLKYHVVVGKNTVTDFQNAKQGLVTLNNKKLNLKLDDQGIGQVTGDKNTVAAPVDDIVKSESIIHITTSVLLQ
jgi:uncharacterized surface protein with fasciclin (FAS1) repeats